MSTIVFKPETDEVSKEHAENDVITKTIGNSEEGLRSTCMANLNENPNYGIICKEPDYDVKVQRQKTHAKPVGEGRHVVIISCFDPRSDAAAELVLKHIHYPGLYLQVRVAGGRAIDALRSLLAAHYVFQIEVIAVVHHTFCGCTSFTLPTISKALMEEDGIELNEETLGSECLNALTIDNLSQSVKDDVKLIEERVASRKTKVLGFVYDIMTGKLIEISTT